MVVLGMDYLMALTCCVWSSTPSCFVAAILEILSYALQTIFVSRLDADSRQQCSQEIERRARSGGLWPPVLIFPEGKLVHLSSHSIHLLNSICSQSHTVVSFTSYYAGTTTNRKRILLFKNGKLYIHAILSNLMNFVL